MEKVMEGGGEGESERAAPCREEGSDATHDGAAEATAGMEVAPEAACPAAATEVRGRAEGLRRWDTRVRKGGREGEREGGREREREGGREGGREGLDLGFRRRLSWSRRMGNGDG